MYETIKYHNDLNRIQLPSFTEQEQNLLFGLIALIKEKSAGNIIRLYPQDFAKMFNKNLSNREFTEILSSFENKFFRADFTILLRDGKHIGKMRTHLFNHFVVWKEFREHFDRITGWVDAWEEFTRIDIEVNQYFEYLINAITANFTRFELAEFMALSGKYTKTLYRLLKQFRNTGCMKMEWQEFMRVVDIPYTRQTDIDQFILKPALKELTKERNLFDKERIPFKNLQYKKIKRGGNKVVAIEFHFTPEIQESLNNENDELEQRAKEMGADIQTQERYITKIKIGNYEGQYFTDKYGKEVKIVEVRQDSITGKIIMKCKNKENETEFEKEFPTANHLNKYLYQCGLEINKNEYRKSQVNEMLHKTIKRF